MGFVLARPVGRVATLDGIVRASVFAAGAAAAGLGSAVLLWLGVNSLQTDAAQPLRAVGVWILVVAIASDLSGLRLPLPQRHAQVPRRWLLWRHRWLCALCFGSMIGAGWLTYIEFAGFFVLAVAITQLPTALVAAAVGGAYGFARSATLLMSWLAPPVDTVAFGSWLAGHAKGVRRVVGFACLCTTGVLYWIQST